MTRRINPLSAVVDTNLFFSGLIKKGGAPYKLILAWHTQSFRLAVSEQLSAEYQRVLSSPKLITKYHITPEEVSVLLEAIEVESVSVRPRRRLPVAVRDPKDEMVLAAALGGKVEYLVTGDQDLLVLRDSFKIGSLKIVTVREFVEILETVK